MLDIEELLELEEDVKEKLDESLEEILVKLNRSDKLDEFLQMIGLSCLSGEHNAYAANCYGKIIVIGQCEVEKDKLTAVARNLGIDKSRFEFYLDYEDAKTFNFKKTQWSDAYSVILVGQMPHSGNAKGKYSSIISAIENQEGYPPVIPVGVKGLKMSKASFRLTLQNLIKDKKIA